VTIGSPATWHAAARRAPSLLCGIVAFALVLESTEPRGPGLEPDSMSYLAGAEFLVRGQGFASPAPRWWDPDTTAALTHFPPGYSVAIAIPTAAGMAPIQAGRLVNAAAAFVTFTVLVTLVVDATAPLFGAVFGAALMSVAAMHIAHVAVLSEPLYLALTALTLAAMVRERRRSPRTGVYAALAFMVRYVGVSLAAAAALWSVSRAGTLRARLRSMAASLAPTAVLGALWVLHAHDGNAEPIRRFALYGALKPTIVEGVKTVAAWLVPDPDRWGHPLPHRTYVAALTGGGLLVVVVRGILALRRARAVDERSVTALRLLAADAWIIASYLAVLGASRVFADPAIPFDERILSPFLMLATMFVFVAAYHEWTSSARLAWRIALAGAGLAWWTAGSLVTFDRARNVRRMGYGYTEDRWQRSAIIRWAAEHEQGRRLYTNRPVAPYLVLHRVAHDVPTREEEARLDDFADTVRAHRGTILMFRLRTRYMDVDAIRRLGGLRPVLEHENGVVLVPADDPRVAGAPVRKR